jgi:hypothetical protein
MANTFAKLTATCRHCQSDKSALVQETGILLYKHGALVQKAFPHEDADTREIIMASLNNSYFLCPTCWDTQFPEESEA